MRNAKKQACESFEFKSLTFFEISRPLATANAILIPEKLPGP